MHTTKTRATTKTTKTATTATTTTTTATTATSSKTYSINDSNNNNQERWVYTKRCASFKKMQLTPRRLDVSILAKSLVGQGR